MNRSRVRSVAAFVFALALGLSCGAWASSITRSVSYVPGTLTISGLTANTAIVSGTGGLIQSVTAVTNGVLTSAAPPIFSATPTVTSLTVTSTTPAFTIGTTPSLAGAIRLPYSTDAMTFRNSSNSGNLTAISALSVGVADVISIGRDPALIALGNPATLSGASAGDVTLANASALRATNAAGTTTLALLSLNASNNTVLGNTTGSLVFSASALFTDNVGDIGASGATRPRDAFFARNHHVAGYMHAATALALGTHVVVVANNGVATANTEIIQGDRSVYLVECNDPQGCTIQLGTTSITPGQFTSIVNTSTNSNVLTVGNIGTTQHVQSLFTLSSNHIITMMFSGNRSGALSWIEYWRNGRAL